MSFIGDVWDDLTGKTAAKAARKGAETSADAQTEALEYLKESEAIPQEYRLQAMEQLGTLFGLPGMGGDGAGGYPEAKSQYIDGLKDDPFYNLMLDSGEDAINRNMSATGGLRSGTANEALAQNNQNILRTLYNDQLSGLQGFAGIQSIAPQVAQGMTGVGNTLAQGQIASGAAQSQGMQNLLNMGLGFGSKFIKV